MTDESMTDEHDAEPEPALSFGPAGAGAAGDAVPEPKGGVTGPERHEAVID